MTTNFRKKSDAFDDAFSQLQKSVCFVKSESSPQRRNHDHATCGSRYPHCLANPPLIYRTRPIPKSISLARFVPHDRLVQCLMRQQPGLYAPRDARSCETSIAGLFKRLDPVCEAAKAAQNQIYDSQRVACESSKAAERAQCEAREQFCFSVAKVCSDDREKAAASN